VLQFDPPGTDKDYVHRSGRTGRAGEPGLVITLVSPEKEKDVRKMQRELRRREPIEVASVATAATILASSPPKVIDRGDGLDGVSRRERARAEDRPRQERPGGPNRKPHRKGQNPRSASANGERTEGQRRFESQSRDGRPSGTGTPARNGQDRAGAPARSGRPAAPGRRPAGAGSARPGRPASGNARRRTR
jgi:superfamily II DNA/RNA helicase